MITKISRKTLLLLTLATVTSAQTLPRDVPGPGDPVVKHADTPIIILHPTIDKTKSEIRIPAAFWNQHMTSWVEVAMCGRPSDFLHETIVCVTTTKAILMQALRDIGCRDADEWVNSVQDFPKIRGDRLLITLEVTRNGKAETYSLDELLTYEGWNISTGPYGWMFKGDPGGNSKPETRNSKLSPVDSDRTRIVRDDPQIALVLKGIQHFSQSFAEQPLAYDDWIYPMMRYGRNFTLLPAAVYDSNGDVPVQLAIRKVNEEELIIQSAAVWHDAACRAYMLQQIRIAKDIDAKKTDLWKLLPEVKKLSDVPADKRDALKESATFGRASVLAAQIEKGYAELDAAWATWAADHAAFDATDPKELAELKSEAALWKEHMTLRRTHSEELALAVAAAFAQKQIKSAATPEAKQLLQYLRGSEISARSAAMLADAKQPLDYWKYQQSTLDRKTDPRTDWIASVDMQVDLLNAKLAAAAAGISYGHALYSTDATSIANLQTRYTREMALLSYDQLRLQLSDVNFELSKREGFSGGGGGDDPDLPKLQQQKIALESALKQAAANTQPANDK